MHHCTRGGRRKKYFMQELLKENFPTQIQCVYIWKLSELWHTWKGKYCRHKVKTIGIVKCNSWDFDDMLSETPTPSISHYPLNLTSNFPTLPTSILSQPPPYTANHLHSKSTISLYSQPSPYIATHLPACQPISLHSHPSLYIAAHLPT